MTIMAPQSDKLANGQPSTKTFAKSEMGGQSAFTLASAIAARWSLPAQNSVLVYDHYSSGVLLLHGWITKHPFIVISDLQFALAQANGFWKTAWVGHDDLCSGKLPEKQVAPAHRYLGTTKDR